MNKYSIKVAVEEEKFPISREGKFSAAMLPLKYDIHCKYCEHVNLMLLCKVFTILTISIVFIVTKDENSQKLCHQ